MIELLRIILLIVAEVAVVVACFSLNAQTPWVLQTNDVPVLCPPPKDPNHITVEEGRRILQVLAADVQSYERSPQRWHGSNLIYVARGYISETNFQQAIVVYQKLLSTQADNTDAILGLGGCYVMNHQYNEASAQYKRGWMLGDDLALVELANLYCVLTPQHKELEPFISDLLKVRGRTTASDVKHEITNDLLLYSINTSNRGVFLKAMDGLSDEFILERKDTREIDVHGLEVFGFKDRAAKLKAEMAKQLNY